MPFVKNGNDLAKFLNNLNQELWEEVHFIMTALQHKAFIKNPNVLLLPWY